MGGEIDQRMSQEDVDLYKFVLLLIHQWKIILIFITISVIITSTLALFMPTQYVATAVVSIDNASISLLKTSPSNLLNSDFIRSEIANQIGIPVEDIPDVEFLRDEQKSDKTIIRIVVESEDPDLSISVANIWAEVGINWILNNLQQIDNDLLNAKKEVDNADAELFTYLDDNGIDQLSWVDLVAMSGVGDMSGIILQASKQLPTLTMQQRLDVAKMMRQKNLAEWNYSTISEKFFSNNYGSEYKVLLLNRAIEAENNSIILVLIPIGFLVGLVVSITWILLSDWWTKSAEKEKQY